MITKEQAIEIAKKLVPDLEERISKIKIVYEGSIREWITDKKPYANLFGGIPDNCWYITYSSLRNDEKLGAIIFIGSRGIFIDKDSGEVVFHGDLHDEG